VKDDVEVMFAITVNVGEFDTPASPTNTNGTGGYYCVGYGQNNEKD
jgi:hypothetical protein